MDHPPPNLRTSFLCWGLAWRTDIYFENTLCSTCFLTKLVEEIKPVQIYKNFKQDRASLIKENNGKIGVYCLVNLVNGNFYIGSSSNLAVRMRNYLNNSFLEQSQNANML
jgi:hypothetical protein